jgi:hypothetical protein
MQTNVISAPQRPHCRRNTRQRRPLSARVHVCFEGKTYAGWTLNASTGGLRIILEDGVLPPRAYVSVRVEGAGINFERNAHIAWTKGVQGGSIAGLSLVASR